MKTLFLYSVLALISCKTNDCRLPEIANKIISSQKGFEKGKAVRIEQISSLWKNSGGTEKVVCPNQVIGDFTKDGEKDIILMYFDNTDLPNLVAVVNFETMSPKFQNIAGVNWDGIYMIDALYKDKGDVYAIKLESSLSKITWKKNKFTIDVIGD